VHEVLEVLAEEPIDQELVRRLKGRYSDWNRMRRTGVTSGISPAKVGGHNREHEPYSKRGLNNNSYDCCAINTEFMMLGNIDHDFQEQGSHWNPSPIGRIYEGEDDDEDDEDNCSGVILDDEVVYCCCEGTERRQNE